MDKKQKADIIAQETGKVKTLDNMMLLFSYAKVKHMNQTAPTNDDRDITHAILTSIKEEMKKRNLDIASETPMENGMGLEIRRGSEKTPPAKYEPKKVNKAKAKTPATLTNRKGMQYSDISGDEYVTKTSVAKTLTFHDLMNLNEARVAKEGELV